MKPSILYKTATWVAKITFLFWLIETIAFIIIEGWHMKATHPIEILSDKIVVVGIKICFVLIVWCMLSVLKYAAEFVDYTREYDPKDYKEKDELP